MADITGILLKLIRSELTGEEVGAAEFADFNDEDWESLYSVSKSHDIAHLVGNALIKRKLIPDGKTKDGFQKQYVTAVYRYQHIKYELAQIRQILRISGIPFIPLKGAVIREMYPEPWMRTSCDIDILIREEDIPKAAEALKNGGYTMGKRNSHDVAFTSDANVHLELHFDLLEEGRIEKAEMPLKSVWEYAKQVEGTSEYVLYDEMFYYYHVVHMAKHLKNGGCGIRPFVDLWILGRIPERDTAGRNVLLNYGGVDKFAKEANEIVGKWFEEKEASPLALQLEDYVLRGGVYGIYSNLMTVKKSEQKSKAAYLRKRIWLPYEDLSVQYPNLKGKRVLQPYYEACRWTRLLNKKKSKRARAEMKAYSSVTDEQTSQMNDMLQKLGLN